MRIITVEQLISDYFVGKNLSLYRVDWVNTHFNIVKGCRKYYHKFHVEYFVEDLIDSPNIVGFLNNNFLFGMNYENEILYSGWEHFKILKTCMGNGSDYCDDPTIEFTLENFRNYNNWKLVFDIPQPHIEFNLYENFIVE